MTFWTLSHKTAKTAGHDLLEAWGQLTNTQANIFYYVYWKKSTNTSRTFVYKLYSTDSAEIASKCYRNLCGTAKSHI